MYSAGGCMGIDGVPRPQLGECAVATWDLCVRPRVFQLLCSPNTSLNFSTSTAATNTPQLSSNTCHTCAYLNDTVSLRDGSPDTPPMISSALLRHCKVMCKGWPRAWYQILQHRREHLRSANIVRGVSGHRPLQAGPFVIWACRVEPSAICFDGLTCVDLNTI